MKKILIIEDEPTISKSLCEALEAEGFSILEASDGKAGLETALKEKPDLILLDIELPKMDGLSVLDSLREDDWGKDAQIIILSIHSESENVAHAMERGTYDYIVKSDQSLENIIKKVKQKLS